MRQSTVVHSLFPRIDCDAPPFVPEQCTVHSHRGCGQLVWDPRRVELYRPEYQRGTIFTPGVDLLREFENKPVLNANVLDFLLAHPALIPREWKPNPVLNDIVFWGTIYRDEYNQRRFVRVIHCHGGDDGNWWQSWVAWIDGPVGYLLYTSAAALLLPA